MLLVGEEEGEGSGDFSTTRPKKEMTTTRIVFEKTTTEIGEIIFISIMNFVSGLSDGIVKSEAFTTTRPESTYKTTTKIGKKPKNLLPICKNFHI